MEDLFETLAGITGPDDPRGGDRISKEEEDRLVNGSGLFFFKTKLDKKTMVEIVKWYKGLPEKDRKYVDILRNEASDETDFFSQGD